MLFIASNLYIQIKRTKQDLSLRCTKKNSNFSLHTIFLSDIFTFKWLLDATRKFFNVLAHCKNFLKLIAYEKILLEVTGEIFANRFCTFNSQNHNAIIYSPNHFKLDYIKSNIHLQRYLFNLEFVRTIFLHKRLEV